MTFFVTFTLNLKTRIKSKEVLMLLNGYRLNLHKKVAKRSFHGSFYFPLSMMGSTQVEYLLDIRFEMCDTDISISSQCAFV